MKLFIDSANLEEIREISQWGIIEGVTTNPSLIAKEGKVFEEIIEKITETVQGPISAEVLSLKSEEMIKEGKELASIDNNIVIKIPFCEEGLKAISQLNKEGIKCNCTLIFSSNQALLAAKAGAAYVSPFLGRLDDIGHEGIELINEIRSIFDFGKVDTEIIAASIRYPRHVIQAALAGSHIATIPYKVFKQMLNHPLTDSGIDKFIKDFEGTRRKNG